jgi:hypothetical protein
MIKDNFSINVPLGSVSFGQISYSILREIKELGLNPNIFPIGGNVDASAQKIEPDFGNWLNNCISKANKTHQRDFPVFRLWHFSQSLESLSNNKQLLYTFWETDQPTAEELNTVKNNRLVALSSQYAVDIFKNNFNCSNVIKLSPGFDKYNFFNTNKKYFDDDRIVFNVIGKVEPLRKSQPKVIQSWIKKYGGNKKYWLHCSIWNVFLSPEQNQKIVQDIMQGQNVPNVMFYPWSPQNAIYNDYLNAADIIIGMGNESFGLAEHTSLCLGKHAILLNANGYKEYATPENSVLINPNGKVEANDMFFQKGAQYNQGSFFTWDVDEFLNGCDEAIKRVESNRVNTEGLKLKDKFTYSNTVKTIIENLEKF